MIVILKTNNTKIILTIFNYYSTFYLSMTKSSEINKIKNNFNNSANMVTAPPRYSNLGQVQ